MLPNGSYLSTRFSDGRIKARKIGNRAEEKGQRKNKKNMKIQRRSRTVSSPVDRILH